MQNPVKGRKFTSLILPGLFLLAAVWAGAQESDLLIQGKRAFYAGRMNEAQNYLVGYLRVNPRNTDARIHLARSLAGLARPQDALIELKKVLESDPDNLDALFYLSSLSAAMTQETYARLYRLAPESPRVHQLLGESYQLRENFDDARTEYRKALELDPNLLDVVISLADVERTMGRFQEALASYRRALELAPSDYRALYGMGVCFRFLEDDQQAETYFRRTVQTAPGYAAGRLALGQALLRSGKTEAAVPELREAIRLEPELDQAYFQLGRAFQTLGRNDEAQTAFDQARRLRLKNSPRQ